MFSRAKKNQPNKVGFRVSGGAEEDRTPDLRIANATLSQLSYRPEERGLYTLHHTPAPRIAARITAVS